MATVTQRITPFPNSRVRTTMRYDEATARAAGRPAGSVMTVAFELDGQEMAALMAMKKIDLEGLQRA